MQERGDALDRGHRLADCAQGVNSRPQEPRGGVGVPTSVVAYKRSTRSVAMMEASDNVPLQSFSY